MLFSRIHLIFSLVGCAGLGVAASTIGGRSFKTYKIEAKKQIDKRNRVYRLDCYKWIIGKNLKTSGNVFACNDTRENKLSPPLIFVLWLLPKETGEYNYPYGVFSEIEKIKLESDKSISFTFASKESKYSNEKFTSARGLYWDSSKQQKYPDLEFNKISDKSLKDGCRIEGNYLKCSTYDDFQAPVEKSSINIKFSY